MAKPFTPPLQPAARRARRADRRRPPPERNRLLGALSGAEYGRVLDESEDVGLIAGQVLYEPGHAVSHVYFPQDCVVSLVCCPSSDTAVAVAMTGREGVVGLPLLRGVRSTILRSIVQVPGHARRVRADALRDLTTPHDRLRGVIARFAQALFDQIAFCAACNVGHSPRERFARWLLMLHDRVEGEELPVTQEFLAHMLGMSRQTVSGVARALQDDGLVDYARGRMRVAKRAALERVACPCYRCISDRLEELLGDLSRVGSRTGEIA